MESVKTKSELVKYISHSSHKKKASLSLVVKKSFQINNTGQCIPLKVSNPIIEDIEFYNDTELISADIDLYPLKPLTDVIVKGTVLGDGKNRMKSVEIKVGTYSNKILLLGDRNAYLDKFGKLKFSDPQVIEAIPLRYDYAYGGKDEVATQNHTFPNEDLLNYLSDLFSKDNVNPYIYPRNPLGKGYLFKPTKEAVQQVQLPNIEDEIDRLFPETLALLDIDRWPQMPIPRATDWVEPSWFPRMMYFGLFDMPANQTKNLKELKRGWSNDTIIKKNKVLAEHFDFRCGNGASLGFQFPFLRGNERCQITNLRPDFPKINFSLPNMKPELFMDNRKGGFNSSIPNLQTVVINLDKMEIDMVWSAYQKALRPYLENELLKMPYKVRWN